MRRHVVVSFLLTTSLAAAADPPSKKKVELGFVAHGGSLQTDAGGALGDGGAGAVLGIGLDQRLQPGVTGTLDLTLTGADYELPFDPGPFADDEVDIDTIWIGYLLKGVVSGKRAELYAGLGPTLAFSEASIHSEALLFGAGTVAEEEDGGLGFQAVAGVDIRVGERSRVGVEYRRLQLDLDFGELSGGEVDVGGDVFVFVWRSRVGR